MSADTMKAQRGRRGLISYGEVMPSKLTKGQKKLAKKKNDISSILAAHKVDAALTTPAAVGSVQWGKVGLTMFISRTNPRSRSSRPS